jgi:D-3-phosphoglycerate dehydrogenase / 2-oxoglutarate reductase
MKGKVIVAANISDAFKNALAAVYELDYNYSDDIAMQQTLGIVTSTKLQLTAEVLKQCIHLKWIARLGSGQEIIDTTAAQHQNIQCYFSPAGIANSVAEHALGMLLALNKRIVLAHNEVVSQLWIREPNRGWEISGKVIGIIGYGHTGKAFTQLLSSFDVQVLVYDKYSQPNQLPVNTTAVSLNDIYLHADVVSYHIPFSTETDNYYNPNLFAKPHVLINTSRGAIARTTVIQQAFEQGKLIGACLDVLDAEYNNPFTATSWEAINALTQFNCIITPHIAGYSHNAVAKMSAELQLQLQIAGYL